MKRRRITRMSLPAALLAAAAFVALPGSAADLSPPVPFDHGFRYAPNYDSDGDGTCRARVRGDEVLFVVVAQWDGGLHAYRYRADGSGVPLRQTQLLQRGTADWPPERKFEFDVSEFDGSSWKLAWAVRDSILVRALDPETLAQVGGRLAFGTEEAQTLYAPTLTWTGRVHLLTWHAMDGAIHLVRLGTDLAPLDASPLRLTGTAPDPGVALHFSATDGMMAYVDSTGWLTLQRLDLDGHLVGAPGRKWNAAGHPEIAITRFLGGWAVIARHGYRFRFGALDEAGADDPGQSFEFAPQELGFAVCGSPTSVLITSRGYWGVDYALVDANGYHTLPFGDYAPGCIFDDRLPDWVDCAWTGRDFVVLCGQAACLPTLAETGAEGWGCYLSWPVPYLARWLAEDGAPLTKNPIQASQSTLPYLIGVPVTSNGPLALSGDSHTYDYMHTRPLESDGSPLDPPTRVRTAAWNDPCTSSRITGVRLVSDGGDPAIAYQVSVSRDGDMYYWNGRFLVVDGIDPDGGFKQRSSWEVASAYDASIPWIGGWDAAVLGGELLLCTDLRAPGNEPWPSRILARSSSVDGYVHASWSIDPDSAAYSPAAAALPGGFALAWTERTSGQSKLMFAYPLREYAQGHVEGRQLIAGPGHEGDARLIAGSNQLLCVYRHDDAAGGGTDLRAVRLSKDGVLLDGAPILINASTPNLRSIHGVWDGMTYVLTWVEGSSSAWRSRLARVARNGQVVDPEGIDVRSAGSRVVPTVRGPGDVILACGDRIYFFRDDATPVGTATANAQRTDSGVSLTWELPPDLSEATSRLFRCEVTADRSEPPLPPAGYERIALEDLFVGVGPHVYTDEGASPDVSYAYAVAIEGADGSATFGPPVLVRALRTRLSLARPAPNPARGTCEITFTAPAGRAVRLQIVDPGGRRVRDLVRESTDGRPRPVLWDGRNDAGRLVAPGIYWFRLSEGPDVRTRPVVYIR